jgi:hypothetical protein
MPDTCSPTLLPGARGILPRSTLVHSPDSQLYRIEDQVRFLAPPAALPDSPRASPLDLESSGKRAEELQPKLLPQSTLGKAVRSFINRCEALLGYLEEGRFEIDNNLFENNIRPTAVGRRRWLFIGHPTRGWRSAVVYSLLISARQRGLNRQANLTDVLARLLPIKITQIHCSPATGNLPRRMPGELGANDVQSFQCHEETLYRQTRPVLGIPLLLHQASRVPTVGGRDAAILSGLPAFRTPDDLDPRRQWPYRASTGPGSIDPSAHSA